MEIKVQRLVELPLEQLELLRSASVYEGFTFLMRLIEEWHAGKNRFDQPEELLLGAYAGPALVGACGLNVDPYVLEAGVGRLRHLYVLPAHRRQGVGQRLVNCCLEAAKPHFHLVRLRTDSEYAARFYERLGFREVSCVDACTHVLNLRE
jgi:GNAT superfamily N-acetyltransferase